MSQEREKTSLTRQTEAATLGGGCFWCIEAVFNEIRGVEKVQSGYSGGALPYPTYEQVSTGTTGHAEAVQVTFDPKIISFKEILEIFFTVHDPTTLNRQGPDVGTRYRSVIFYHNAEQKATAEKVVAQLNSAKIWRKPIVTQIEPFEAFYEAEDYHNKYFQSHREQPYCKLVIEPKVAKLRKHYTKKLKKPQMRT